MTIKKKIIENDTQDTEQKKVKSPNPRFQRNSLRLLPSIYLPASFPLALTGAGRHFPQLDAGQ